MKIYLARIILLSAFVGLGEGMLLNISGTTGDRVLLGHFSLYHLVALLPTFLLIGLREDGKMTWYSLIHYLPSIIIIQDFVSHMTTGGFGEWAKWPLDKLWLGVPYFYFLCLSLQIFFIILYYGLRKLRKP